MAIDAFITIFAGAYGWLMATGKIPKKPKDPEKMKLWRKKFGPMMKILGPFLVIVGSVRLISSILK